MGDSRQRAYDREQEVKSENIYDEGHKTYCKRCNELGIKIVPRNGFWVKHSDEVEKIFLENKKQKKEIIAHIGVIGSGKDHNTKILHQSIEGSKILGFSDGVREFTWNILGWKPENNEEYEYFKDNAVMNLSTQDWIAVKSLKGRQILENVADQMRRFDSEFWGKVWKEKAKRELATASCLIVPDCRHIEEAEKIVNLAIHLGIDYKFYFCNYKSERYEIRNHSSEKMAQELLAMGCWDGDLINYQVSKVMNK